MTRLWLTHRARRDDAALAATMIGARERNRGAEAVLEQCGGPPDSKGLANGGRRGARAARGPGEDISRHGKGVNNNKGREQLNTMLK